jgi:hypothetical protein
MRRATESDGFIIMNYYERTNSDGTEDERVTVFRRDASTIEVYKARGLCKGAGFVSAEMDWTSFSAGRLVGGRLQPGGTHRDIAFLDWNKAENRLDIRVALHDMEIREEAPVGSMPWHLYDFDFASLTVATPRLADPARGFSFDMAMAWNDPSAGDPMTWMGDVRADYAGEET